MCWALPEIILDGLHHLDLDSDNSEGSGRFPSRGQYIHPCIKVKTNPSLASLASLDHCVLVLSLKAFRIQALSSSTSFLKFEFICITKSLSKLKEPSLYWCFLKRFMLPGLLIVLMMPQNSPTCRSWIHLFSLNPLICLYPCILQKVWNGGDNVTLLSRSFEDPVIKGYESLQQ